MPPKSNHNLINPSHPLINSLGLVIIRSSLGIPHLSEDEIGVRLAENLEDARQGKEGGGEVGAVGEEGGN